MSKISKHGNHHWFAIMVNRPTSQSSQLRSSHIYIYMDVSENRGFPPKSSILIGFSIINHIFWGTSIFGNTHMFIHEQTTQKKPNVCVFKSVEIFSSLLGLFLQISMFQIQNGQVQTLRRTCRATGQQTGQ